MLRLLSNWFLRHEHPFNRALHLLGIPLGNLAPLILALIGTWWWAAAALLAGYLLQFLGHAVEGNDPGEVILIKKLLGRPYVAAVTRPAVTSRHSPLSTTMPAPSHPAPPTPSLLREL